MNFFKRIWAFFFPKPSDTVWDITGSIIARPDAWQMKPHNDDFVLSEVNGGFGNLAIYWHIDDDRVSLISSFDGTIVDTNRADRSVLLDAIELWSDSVTGQDFWSSWNLNNLPTAGAQA